MSFEEKTRTISLEAGADLSAKQYYFVDVNTSGKAILASDQGTAVGVLQNKPKSGQTAEIVTSGVSKVLADADGFTAADKIGVGAAGAGQTAETGEPQYGRALATATSGQIAACLVNCENAPALAP